MNQLAHPGGGTQVTEASREGLVEDLYEAHLRHLDVATKSSVVGRLILAANNLDTLGVRSAVSDIDLLISVAGQGGAASPDVSEVLRLIGIMRDIITQVDTKNIENHAAGKLYEELRGDVLRLDELISANTLDAAAAQASILEQKLLRFDISSDLAEALGGGDSLWGYITRDKVTEAKKLLVATSMLRKQLQSIAQFGARGTESPGASRERATVPQATPEEAKALQQFAREVGAMADEYDDLDARTEEWKSEMSPQNYNKLHAEFMRDIPNLGYLNRLPGLRERLDGGRIRASQIPSYAPVIAGLKQILYAFRTKVNEVDSRLLGVSLNVTGGE
jgi:hypothetical protein